MKINPSYRILCYGDSLTFGKVPGPVARYNSEQRWTGILQKKLGEECEIIEEGLRGRTTDIDDPSSKGRNGLKYFFSCVLSHLPFDQVIILLGTNDLKNKFGRKPSKIANSFLEYKKSLIEACQYLEEKEPKILLIAPPQVLQQYAPVDWGFEGAEEKSKELGRYYSEVAKSIGADFLDSSKIQPSTVDGIHLDESGNQKLAELVFEKLGL